MNSVNTNVGAMVALQNLNRTNSELSVVQARINTGLKVSSAKDNGAIWAIAQNQRSESQALNAVKESLQRGISTVDVAMAAGESISDLLLQMKEKALAATDTTLDDNSRTALSTDFTSLRDQIKKIVANAEFNGSNMIKATTPVTVAALANTKATSKITVASQNLAVGGSNVTVLTNDAFNVAGATAGSAKAASVLARVEASITAVSAALTKFGTGSKAIQTHLNFVTKLQDTLDAGVGNLVDADLAKESARLQALQTKQQLGIQALAIANSSSSTLLGLFR